MRRRDVSLGTKVGLAIAAVVVAASALIYFESTRRVWDNLVEGKRQSAVMVSDLFVASVAPAVGAGERAVIDAQAEQLRSMPDLLLAVVWGAGKGPPVAQVVADQGTAVVGRPQGKQREERIDDDAVTVIRYLPGPQGTNVGHAVLRFSLAPEIAAYQAARVRILVLVGVLAVGLIALLVVVARLMIIKPLRRLGEAVAALERGDSPRLKILAKDEIGTLAEAFNSLADTIAERERDLQELSLIDPLTKLRNRRFFNTTVETDVARVVRVHDPREKHADRENRDLGVYMVDIDFLKRINEAHGHLAGDEVLVELSERLQGVARRHDSVIRWGGEEFLVVARETHGGRGEVLAERILEVVGQEPFKIKSGEEVPITCCVGWAVFPWLPDKPTRVSVERVVELAERALQMAKQSGRNRAIGAVPPAEPAITEPNDIQSALFAADLATLEGTQMELVRTEGPEVETPPSEDQ